MNLLISEDLSGGLMLGARLEHDLCAQVSVSGMNSAAMMHALSRDGIDPK